jgi:hypothetical protein
MSKRKKSSIVGIIVVAIFGATLSFCGKNEQLVIPTSPGSTAENAVYENGIWTMTSSSVCINNSCTKTSSRIPVKERDILVIESLKARGITDGKYKNNPWISAEFITNHIDYRNQKVKLCFQNKFVVKNGTDYLIYIDDDFNNIQHLNIMTVTSNSENCWEPNKAIKVFYTNNTWASGAQSDLAQFLEIGQGQDYVEIILGDSFKDNSTNKRINSEVILQLEVK